ncbi:hypothetical protein [Actinophytocola sp. KF-1]
MIHFSFRSWRDSRFRRYVHFGVVTRRHVFRRPGNENRDGRDQSGEGHQESGQGTEPPGEFVDSGRLGRHLRDLWAELRQVDDGAYMDDRLANFDGTSSPLAMIGRSG